MSGFCVETIPNFRLQISIICGQVGAAVKENIDIFA